MDNFIIEGGHELFGEVNISGAKNAAVAIIPAAILADDVVRIENIPAISDVSLIIKILDSMGAGIKMINKNTIEVDSRSLKCQSVPYELTSCFRASYYLIGAMLGRFKQAQVAMPGGCNFGVRPIDLHIKGFELLGAQVNTVEGMVCARADKLIGASIYMDQVSVGATINVMLAAVLARGLTVIENAAKEPHIVDLANFLNSMGADVRGAGTDVIKIRGVEKMHGCTYSIIPDQIEAGTYMVAAAACGGDVLVKNVIPKHLESISAKLEEAGAEIIEYDDAVRITRFKPLTRCNVKTMPHPGFPTDMQPQMAVLLSVAEGTSILTEGVGQSLPVCRRVEPYGRQYPGGRQSGCHRGCAGTDRRYCKGYGPARRCGHDHCRYGGARRNPGDQYPVCGPWVRGCGREVLCPGCRYSAGAL